MHFCKPTSLKTGTLYYLYFIGNSFLISYHLGCYNFFLTYIILLKSLMKITLKYHLPKLCLWQRWQKKLLLYTMSSKSTFIDVINCLYIYTCLCHCLFLHPGEDYMKQFEPQAEIPQNTLGDGFRNDRYNKTLTIENKVNSLCCEIMALSDQNLQISRYSKVKLFQVF